MNPELRAQLEKLDVWNLAVAQRKTPSTTNKDELNRQGWKAYYEVEKQKRVVSGKEDEPIHVPACFREAAAEDGVYRESSESKTPLTPVPSQGSDSTKIKELKNTVFELNRKTEKLNSEKQTLEQELQELKLKEQDSLKQEQDLKSEIAGLKKREQDFEIAIQDLKSQNSELSSKNQTLHSKEQDLLSRLDQIEHDHAVKLQALESSTPPQTESIPEQVSSLQQQLQETTEKLEKALSEAETQRTENESVMVLI